MKKQNASEQSPSENWKVYKNLKYDYEIAMPSEIYKQKSNTDSQIFFGNVPVLSKPEGDEFDIDLTTDVTSSSYYYACNDTSIKNPIVIEDTKDTHTIRGNIPDPPCYVDHCDNTKFGYSQYQGRYVLCSEHQGKALRIEVEEITDNPELAQKIFSTFKWTK